MNNLPKGLLLTQIVLSFIFNSISIFAQTPDWGWVKSIGDVYNDVANSVTTDSNGNVYMVGNFEGLSITFGDIILKNSNLAKPDMFIVKYNNTGNVLWAKSAHGTYNESARSIAVSKSGNTYVTGSFDSDSINFDNTILYNSNKGSIDIFIVKYDVNGNVVWAKSAGGTATDAGENIILDENGSLYVTGFFTSSSLTLGNSILKNKSPNSHDIFVAKYDSQGNAIWAKSTGGDNFDVATSSAIDKNGNIYVTGSFQSSTVVFGNTILVNTGYDDMFLLKYDSQGNELWAKSIGGDRSSIGNGITIDNSENIYVTGNFSGNATTLENGNLLNTNSGYTAIFIVKYNRNGKIVWIRSADGNANDNSKSIVADSNGNIYIAGSFNSNSITFGEINLINTKYAYGDIVIAKYDSAGVVIWAESVGGGSDERGMNITNDYKGNLYIVGYFYSPAINFGASNIISKTIGDNQSDIFIAKLSNSLTSITEETNTSTINIFPNPAKSTFRISGVEAGNITVYTLEGEKIYESLLKDSQTIDLSGKAKGTYIYQLQKDSEVLKTGKLILE